MSTTRSIHGQKIKTPQGYTAFLPHPLPPSLEWTENLVRSLSEADRWIGQLAQEGRTMPNPHLLVRSFIRREAVLSSQIEGTQTSLSELLADEAGAETHKDQEDLKEVENYVKAMEYGIKRLKTLPISLRLISELHARLMKGVRGDHATPGEFRRSQNWIGVGGCTLQNATYIPPPPHLVVPCLGDLEKFLHESKLPPLVTISLAHSQFEAIHPFLDGNGRVGRLLITLYLIDQKILPSPLLYLSAFFEANRREYYDRLLAVTEQGDWEGWLEYFLNGVARQSEDALKRIQKIQKLADLWKALFTKKSEKNCLPLIDSLLANPFLTVGEVSKKLKLAFTTAQRIIDKLEEKGIVKLRDKAQRNRVYCANEVLKILEG